jgi:Mg2+ and Co2+ transporter CorA
MVKKYRYKGIDWIDLESPTEGDISDLAKTYNLADVLIPELLIESFRRNVTAHEHYFYLTLHFPQRKTWTHEGYQWHEVHFVVGKDFIISIHHGHFKAIETLGQIFEETEWFIHHTKALLAGLLFFLITRTLYQSLHQDITEQTNDLKKISETILTNTENELMEKLLSLGLETTVYANLLQRHHNVLSSLEETGKKFFGGEYTFYTQTLVGEYEKSLCLATLNKSIIKELRETHNSLLLAKRNKKWL